MHWPSTLRAANEEKQMADVDSGTLIASIQAVEIAIKQQERMLAAEVLGDRTDTEEFIFILENAKARLKAAYLEERSRSNNLPEYDDLLNIRA
jgi:hypothetical protein